MVSETVARIASLISEAAGMQRPYAERVCAGCKAPCCARVHYLFSEKDILYLKLSGHKQRWRREAFTRKGCWFLGPTGCLLDPGSRPFICHSYICADLEEAIRKDDPGALDQLRETFRVIGLLRARMWSEYLDEQ
jgi:hypothetical protein